MSNQLDRQRVPENIPSQRTLHNLALPSNALMNHLADVAQNAFDSIPGIKTETPPKSLAKPQVIFSIVARVTKRERMIAERLAKDYSETFVSIVSKSLHLYNAMVEAAKEGGKLVMLTKLPRPSNLCGSQYVVGNGAHSYGSSISQFGASNSSDIPSLDDDVASVEYNEAVIAVREQFAEHGKTPITLNRIYIDAPKGPKSERIAIKADLVFVNALEDLEQKTGLNRSSIIRHSLQLYDFVKRRHEDSSANFFIGDIEIEGI
jgi:hypothetical protein